MASGQVKILTNMTIKAAFIAAFFASFFTNADSFYDTLVGSSPKSTSTQYDKFQCGLTESIVTVEQGAPPFDACKSSIKSYVRGTIDGCNVSFAGWIGPRTGSFTYKKKDPNTKACTTLIGYKSVSITVTSLGSVNDSALSCPNDVTLTHTAGPFGPNQLCYDPDKIADLEAQLLGESLLNKNDNNCENLIVDSGNNTSQNTCYTSPTGTSCEMERVDSVNNSTSFSYYKGVSSKTLGCSASDSPAHDSKGLGNSDDDCVYLGGTGVGDGQNFCKANKDKHTTTKNGVETLDDGCMQVGDWFLCDPKKNPDVGNGDSDFFDDKGTCSIVAGSAYKGSCKDLGGIWSDEGDFQDTQCPPLGIAGSCTSGASGGCMSCLDSGGQWTPDSNAVLDNTAVGLDNVAALTQKGNNQLKALELTNRKGNEALISVMKTSNTSVTSEIKSMSTQIIKAIEKGEVEQPEKETYTTVSGVPDKTKINSLFDASSKAVLEAEITALKAELTTTINTIRAEAKTLFNITVPTAAGYISRDLVTSWSTVDLSLSRFSVFFKLLSGVLMFIATVTAGIILLGGKE